MLTSLLTGEGRAGVADTDSDEAKEAPTATAPMEGGFSYWVGVSFCVNYIMGCGFLAIPYNFVHTGVILGPIVILVFAFIMNISKDYMLEAMGRAECLATLVEQFNLEEQASGDTASIPTVSTPSASGGGITSSYSPKDDASLELSPLVTSSTGGTPAASAASAAAAAAAATSAVATSAPASRSSPTSLRFPPSSAYLVSHHRRFEVADLFSFFLGSRARVVYVAVLSGYMYGALWAYGTVFASSFAANVPVAFFNHGQVCTMLDPAGGVNSACLGPFFTWLAVFALFSIPLACMELTEQISVQVVMFAARLLVVLLMTGTVLHGWASCGADSVVFASSGTSNSSASSASASSAIDGGGLPSTALFSTSGLVSLLPVATYAFIFHHSVPVLAHPVAQKSSLPSLFATAFAVCCLAYGALGLVVSLGFGSAINQQCNLNWKDYVGCVAIPAEGGAGAVSPASAGGLAVAIRFVVLIFPALDVLSAYPLNAITLGNNLQAACMGGGENGSSGSSGSSSSSSSSTSSTSTSSSEAEEGERGAILLSASPSSSSSSSTPLAEALSCRAKSPLALRLLFRLLAAVPPILAGALSTAAGIDLDQILRWTGLIGVAIAFLIPTLLRAASYARSKAVQRALEQAEGCSRESLKEALTRPLTLRELLLDGVGKEEQALSEGLRGTPYTSWSVGGRALPWGLRGDGLMFFFAGVMAVYVFWGLVSNTGR